MRRFCRFRSRPTGGPGDSRSCLTSVAAMDPRPPPMRRSRRGPPRHAAGRADAREVRQGRCRLGRRLIYEPKWDGFRCDRLRDGDEVEIGSRNERPMTRYFPELVEARSRVAARTMRHRRRDRHPGRGHGSTSTPCSSGSIRRSPGSTAGRGRPRPRSSRSTCWRSARGLLAARSPSGGPRSSRPSADAEPPVHLTPATTDPAGPGLVLRLRGAGLDGVVAKPLDAHLRAGQAGDVQGQARAHGRLRGGRLPAAQKRRRGVIGSLLLGLYDDAGQLAERRASSASFPMARRAELVARAPPLVHSTATRNIGGPAWAHAGQGGGGGPRVRRAQSRWNARKDLSFVALDPARRRGRVRPHGGHPVPPHRARSGGGARTGSPQLHVRAAREARSYDLADVLT